MKSNPQKLALAMSVAFAGGAWAQTGATVLPPLVVTARPVIEEVKIDAYSSTTAVVTDDQLRDQNAVDLAAAMRRTPGVQVSRYNPVGAFGGDQGGAVFIRGLGASRPGSEIKTYIDGAPVYVSVANHPLLDMLPLNGMQSITVYKGPQPQINGNNFASINLETKRATRDGVHGDARLSAGSFGTVVEQANLTGRQGDLDYALAQGHAKSKGHRANANGELNNVFGHVGAKLDAHWSVGMNVLYMDNQSNDPGDARQPAPAVATSFDTRGGLASIKVAHVHGDWQGDAMVFMNSGKGRWLNQAPPEGDTLSAPRLAGLRWKEQFSPWQGGTAVAGLDVDKLWGRIDFNRTSPAPSVAYEAPRFTIASPYLALSQNLPLNGSWSLVPSGGLRFYEHSEFASKTSPHAGLSLVSDRVTVFVNVARGVNYPGLDAPMLAAIIPPLGETWKRLSAEVLDHVEAGVKFTPGTDTQIDLSVFHDKVKNRYVIAFPPDVPPPGQFANIESYRMRGIELSVRQSFGGNWAAFCGVTMLDPTIEYLPYAPKGAATAGLTGRIGPVRLALDAQYQSGVWALNRLRMAGATNTERVGAFTVANARLSYPVPALGKKGEVFLAIENLFDRSYAYRPGYAMPGRWAQFGLSASF